MNKLEGKATAQVGIYSHCEVKGPPMSEFLKRIMFFCVSSCVFS